MPISRGEPRPIERFKHWKASITMEAFTQYAKGKTLEGLKAESRFPSPVTDSFTYIKENGPDGKFIYVKDPLDPPQNGKPGGVIDMKHFVSAALLPIGTGEWIGAGVEYNQARKGHDSAHFEEDYKSNFLGVVFGNNYWKKDNDVSDELQQFFQDYQNGQLKGFWPTVDRSIAELGRMGAEGLKQLEQLADFISDYSVRLGQQGVQHLQHFRRTLEKVLKTNPIEGIQRLIDKVSLAEQTLIAQGNTLPQENFQVSQQPTPPSAIPDLRQLQQTYRQYAEIIHPTLATGATPLNQDQAIAYALSRSGYTPGQRAQIIAAGSDNIPGNRTQAHAYVQQTANWPEQRTQQPVLTAQRQQ
jgi:hypothetical protein